ncbi:acyl-CoA-binding protein [Nonomuraea endophytica]|uniref:Acyl-CoA-binding protein n=1 Tax=Nonomuraea endophytica TaxID=714136 RepID=A0A7W8EGM2_9ACTN|nr:acyl-CoA-binding protein [Nonomuraea endophytica]
MVSARGHSHDTGNHYIREFGRDSITGKYLWDWWADNDGGSDGDTKDTYFASHWCGHAPW